MAGLTALIPLDGTRLSETAFSLLSLVKSLGISRIILASVWGWEEHGTSEEAQQELAQRARSYLNAYLQEQARLVTNAGLAGETEIRVGQASEEILKLAEQEGVDLIIIATHGRDGAARWRLGSVADKVVRQTFCPALVIGPNVEVPLAPYAPRRILVPVDGSGFAETAVRLAAWIAETSGAELDLVRVVAGPLLDLSLGTYPVEVIPAVEEAAQSYLSALTDGLGNRSVTRNAVLIGVARERLLDYLKQQPADLVVMASHGRSGIPRAVLGSVADEMLRGPAPVLLLRPDEIEGALMEIANTASGGSPQK